MMKYKDIWQLFTTLQELWPAPGDQKNKMYLGDTTSCLVLELFGGTHTQLFFLEEADFEETPMSLVNSLACLMRADEREFGIINGVDPYAESKHAVWLYGKNNIFDEWLITEGAPLVLLQTTSSTGRWPGPASRSKTA